MDNLATFVGSLVSPVGQVMEITLCGAEPLLLRLLCRNGFCSSFVVVAPFVVGR